MLARTALSVDCTNGGIAFFASPFPQLLAHILFALVQLLFRGRFCREFTPISIADAMRRWRRGINLQARTALYVDYTDVGFEFLVSPFPQLLAHMQFALMQLLFRGRVCRELTRISIADSMWRWCTGINLQARTALYVDCTDVGFAFLASTFPQLLAHMYFTLVQLLFRGRVCREFKRISIADSMRRWHRRNNLQAHTALYFDCANVWFAFLAYPFPQLLAHVYFALVQLLFRGRVCREFTRISIADSMRR